MIDSTDTVTKPLPQPTRMRFASDGRAALQEDLLGDWAVIQSWAGRESRRGGGKITPVASFEEGLALLNSISKRRAQHGYKPVMLAE